MKKTVCDVCGRDITNEYRYLITPPHLRWCLTHSVYDYDLCEKCYEELIEILQEKQDEHKRSNNT